MLEEKIKNIKKDLIKFFKNPKEVIKFFLPIILVICLLIPVPYYIKLGGGIIPLDEKIKIEDEKKSSGSLNSLYVSEIKGNVFLYLLSYVVPSYERVKAYDLTLENENKKDYNSREKIYFEQSSDIATKIAFDKAGQKIDEKTNDFAVLYISKEAKTDLLVGDKILKVNGKNINSYAEFTKVVKTSRVGDKIKFVVLRDNKKESAISEVVDVDNSPKIGIAISNDISYKTDKNIKFYFNKSASGPSGGLMIALSIYNKLVDKDITSGKTIMGTGTISLDGKVGSVGGIRHKLLGAYKKKADIVLVPSGNYKEALKIKKKEGYNFKIISVDSFDDALNKLNL